MSEDRAPDRVPGRIAVLLGCGVAVAVVQIAGDVIAAARYPGYSYAHMTVSELSAIGAPTRSFQSGVGVLFGLLVVAFAGGVWWMADGQRRLRSVAVLLGVFAVNGVVWGLFPMQPRGSAMAATDVAHIVGAVVQVATIVLFIAIGSGAAGRPFRRTSIAFIVAILAAGGLAGTQAGRIAAGDPTPYIGLIERVSFYGPSLWILLLAIVLLRNRPRP